MENKELDKIKQHEFIDSQNKCLGNQIYTRDTLPRIILKYKDYIKPFHIIASTFFENSKAKKSRFEEMNTKQIATSKFIKNQPRIHQEIH